MAFVEGQSGVGTQSSQVESHQVSGVPTFSDTIKSAENTAYLAQFELDHHRKPSYAEFFRIYRVTDADLDWANSYAVRMRQTQITLEAEGRLSAGVNEGTTQAVLLNGAVAKRLENIYLHLLFPTPSPV